MKKAAGQLCLILKGVLFIGFGVQIALGLVWMCFQFVEVQEFAQVEAGIYPLFVRMLGGLPQLMYLMQLGAACMTGGMLVSSYGPSGGFGIVWRVLALLTLPMAMQCHMSLLPYSFVSSLTLLELSFCRKAASGERGVSVRELAKAGCCWLGLALLLPEYGWLGAIAPMLTVLWRLKAFRDQWRQLVYCCLLVAAFGGLIGGIDTLVKAGEKEDYQRTFWFSMASRAAWPTLWNDSEQWSEGLLEVADEIRLDVSNSPGNMKRILQPAIEGAVGTELAQDYYREMAGLAWQLHRSQILKQMAWDVLTYGAPEAVLQLQLTGRGYDAASGRNYEIMLMRHPLWTKYYVNYSCWWLWVSLGTAALLALLRRGAGEKLCIGQSLAFGVMAVLWMTVIVLHYTLQGAGIADYKYTVAAAELWVVLALSGIGRREGQLSTEGRSV